jgi:hypothetical protein
MKEKQKKQGSRQREKYGKANLKRFKNQGNID